MHTLIIYKRFLYDSGCYRKGTIQNQKGVQVHSTGANNPYLKRYIQPDDGLLGKNTNNNSHNNPNSTVCANAYIGKQQDGTVAVYQTLPWDMRCWLSGSGPNGNANKIGYIGFEICEDNKSDADYFYNAVMNKSVLLTAYLCSIIGVNPWGVTVKTASGDALTVMDHSELHDVGFASNHGDITHWLKKYGITMKDYRTAVDKTMKEGVEVTYIDCDRGEEMNILYKAVVIADNGYPVKMRSGPDTIYSVITSVPLGSKVGVLEETDNIWDKVCYNDKYGYMMKKFLQKEDSDTATIPKLKLLEMEACLNDCLGIIKSVKENKYD